VGIKDCKTGGWKNILDWEFTPDDENYNAVTRTMIVNAKATATQPTTANITSTTANSTTKPTTTNTTGTTASSTSVSTTPSVTTPQVTAIPSDADGDRKISVRDCAFIAKMLASGKGKDIPMATDFNGDGKVDVRDAAAIARYLAKNHKN